MKPLGRDSLYVYKIATTILVLSNKTKNDQNWTTTDDTIKWKAK